MANKYRSLYAYKGSADDGDGEDLLFNANDIITVTNFGDGKGTQSWW
jgi:hypothetical protein